MLQETKRFEVLFEAFFEAVKMGRIETLNHLIERTIQHKPSLINDLLCHDNFRVLRCAIRIVSCSSHFNQPEPIEVMNKLIELAEQHNPLLIRDMLLAENFDIFHWAVKHGYFEILSFLIELAAPFPPLKNDVLMAHDVKVFFMAIQAGNIDSLDFLLRLNVIREQAFRLISRSGLPPEIWKRKDKTAITSLFMTHPALFEHACSHHKEEMFPLIGGLLTSLQARQPHGSPLHRVYHQQEAQCLVYLLHHLIERVGLEKKDDILFLLSLSELHALIPQARLPQLTTNLALRSAIKQRSRAATQATQEAWNDILRAIYNIFEVQTEALRENNYQAETEGNLDLRTIAQNHESSMCSLTEEEESQLETLYKYYLPQLNQLCGPGGIEILIAHFKAYYQTHPASFMNNEGHFITLPVNWSAFQSLHLSERERQACLEAYYQHPPHTALRLFLSPNPWMAHDAVFVTGGGAAFTHLTQTFILMMLAAFDENMYPSPNSGFDLHGRIEVFIQSIALITRAHNWDKDVDDLHGDKPSCAGGMKKRLVQSLVAHPLYTPIAIIAEECVRNAVHHHIKAKLAQLNPDGLNQLNKQIINLLINGDLPSFHITFDQKQQTALIEHINKQFDRFHEKEKLLVAVRDEFYRYKDNLIERLCEYTFYQLKTLAKERGIQLHIHFTQTLPSEQTRSDFERIKDEVKLYYKTFQQQLQASCEPLLRAETLESFMAAWKQWTPNTPRAYELQQTLHRQFPDRLAIKSTATLISYNQLPNLETTWVNEEQERDRVIRTTRFPRFFQPSQASTQTSIVGGRITDANLRSVIRLPG